jgi:hypothetical protein
MENTQTELFSKKLKGVSGTEATIQNQNKDKELYATELPEVVDDGIKLDVKPCNPVTFETNKLFNYEALQYGFRSKKYGYNDPPPCWGQGPTASDQGPTASEKNLKVRDVTDDELSKPYTIDHETFNKEKHTFAYGLKYPAGALSKLTTSEKLILNDPYNPNPLLPKKRAGYGDQGFQGFEREKYNYTAY